ncbi:MULTISPECIES: acyl-CoA dehydrogenase family protein [unclassified Aureimonas]|uniref:acyl-CoA dehydrogenase family protein n=1 Tax=unclassified Aureimonas TaxID=2615206 RepID=UPI0006F2F74B|nr:MULTISPECIES: acyl-CoA dehydrogenase family protein [unclassified Aureimonas]KQT68935.1 hypothetical protein ASG54_04535 [Aureimonas sp. Leaf460]KQT69162.1 hypothetical protein ASG62_17140 [Aureimonas sp. Leaf427]
MSLAPPSLRSLREPAEAELLPDAVRADLLAVREREAGRDDPAPFVEVLARHGLLSAFATPAADGGYRFEPGWRAVFDALVTLGGIELSLARLFEGHVNALQLIALYGTAAQQARVLRVLGEGGLLGVWGAEGPEPVRLVEDARGGVTLSGAKRYASGAGLLHTALVPITEAETGRMHLLLLDVREKARVDLSSFDMRGMRRSISGTYTFDGVPVTPADRIGAPDDYRREPFFVGGIWRCAAAQLGAIEAIVGGLAGELGRTGRDGHPLQMARIGQAILSARTARLWIEDTAARIETGAAIGDAPAIAKAVALSAYGRLVTEEAAMTVIDLSERGLGLGSFARSHPLEALTRDLSVYIRQANPDAVLLQHGRVLAADMAR